MIEAVPKINFSLCSVFLMLEAFHFGATEVALRVTLPSPGSHRTWMGRRLLKLAAGSSLTPQVAGADNSGSPRL